MQNPFNNALSSAADAARTIAEFNPMPYEDARYMEVDLAIRLRQSGYGVWQA